MLYNAKFLVILAIYFFFSCVIAEDFYPIERKTIAALLKKMMVQKSKKLFLNLRTTGLARRTLNIFRA